MAKRRRIGEFCFGTLVRPLSAPWFIETNIHGDVYLLNGLQRIELPSASDGVYRCGSLSKRLHAPQLRSDGHLLRFVIFFRPFVGDLPAIPFEAPTQEALWLGIPAEDELYLVEVIYSKRDSEILVYSNQSLLVEEYPVRLNGTEMLLTVLLTHRPLSNEEKTIDQKVQTVQFKDDHVSHLDMFRLSVTPQGVSALVYEPFISDTQSSD